MYGGNTYAGDDNANNREAKLTLRKAKLIEKLLLY